MRNLKNLRDLKKIALGSLSVMLIFMLFSAIFSVLTGCGQKGPLYLPPKKSAISSVPTPIQVIPQATQAAS